MDGTYLVIFKYFSLILPLESVGKKIFLQVFIFMRYYDFLRVVALISA